MYLRPHHLLCIQKFTGHGYDAEFTENMKSVITELVKMPETEITLRCGFDVLCGKCPNRCGAECKTEEKVSVLDRGVLSACGLSDGETLPWDELRRLAKEAVFDTDGFHKICRECSWYELCLATEVVK